MSISFSLSLVSRRIKEKQPKGNENNLKENAEKLELSSVLPQPCVEEPIIEMLSYVVNNSENSNIESAVNSEVKEETVLEPINDVSEEAQQEAVEESAVEPVAEQLTVTDTNKKGKKSKNGKNGRK